MTKPRAEAVIGRRVRAHQTHSTSDTTTLTPTATAGTSYPGIDNMRLVEVCGCN